MTEQPIRSLAKAITWQSTGLVVMTLISWWVTGSASAGGSIALLGAVSGMLAYLVHERLWARISWGRKPS